MAAKMKKIASINKDDIVEIVWEDASRRSGWEEVEEVIQELDVEPSIAYSYGKIVHVSKKRIIIAGDTISLSGIHSVGRSLCIPKRLIIDVKKLKPEEKICLKSHALQKS